MNRLRSLELAPIWVDPDHLVETARLVLDGHHLKLIAVARGSDVVGVVSMNMLKGAPANARVGEYAEPVPCFLSNMEIQSAAERFVQEDLSAAAVIEEGRLVGLITANDLLREVARPLDPLTGLPWIEALREWGIRQLKAGREVTTLFLDLDQLSEYNRKHGFASGDLALQRFASSFRDATNPLLDILVRSGGDEFMIATLRDHDGTLDLARSLRAATSGPAMRDLKAPLTFSVGISGGRRTQEREHQHYEAMIDNLIRLAIEDCSSHKGEKTARPISSSEEFVHPAPSQEAATEPPVEGHRTNREGIDGIRLVAVRSTEFINVIVRANGLDWVATESDVAGEHELSIARATARALKQAFPRYEVALQTVNTFRMPDSGLIVSVFGNLSRSTTTIPLTGTARIVGPVDSAIAEATILGFQQAALSLPDY